MGTYHDYSKWLPEERAFVLDNPNISSAYDAGKLPLSPKAMIYALADMSELQQAVAEGDVTKEQFEQIIFGHAIGSTREVWRKREYFEGQSPETFKTFTAEWKQGLMEDYERQVALGINRSELDPTPWDDITSEDTEIMEGYLIEEMEAARAEQEEAQRQAEADLEAQRIAAEQAAIQTDIDTMYELAGLRSRSEQLATMDVQEYVANTSQYLQLRGVEPGFSEDVVEGLITNRFTEYWSLENEEKLMELASQYAGGEYELPTISNRVWAKGDVTVPQVPDILESVDENTLTSLSIPMSVNLLSEEEDEEEYRKSILLGV